MKLLFISHWTGSGGAEKALFEIIEYLHERQIADCLCVVNGRGSLLRKLRGIGVKCYIVPYRWWCGEDLPRWKTIGRSIINLPMAIAIAAIVVFERISVVYTNTSTVSVGALAAFLTRRPHIWHIHEVFGARKFDLGEGLSTAIMNRLTSKFIVPSEFVAGYVANRLDPRKVVRIHNAVKLGGLAKGIERRHPVPGRLLSVGAISPQKGHEDAVRALAKLVDRGRDVNLRIVGNIEDLLHKSHLDAVATELGVSERVSFAGLVSDIAAEMQAAEVFVMCARDEAFGRVTAEAMLLRCPVVALASGATPEILTHRETGLLCSPGSPGELASAIEEFLTQPALAEQLGQSAYAFATIHFGLDRFFSEWTPAVQSAVSHNRHLRK